MTTQVKTLGEMIADYMSIPGHVPEPKAESDFVISGLRAAMAANPVTRRKIMSDVSKILDCKSEDLEFLFAEIETSSSSASKCEVMVPDFQTELYAIGE